MRLALQGDDNLGGIQDRYAVDDDVDLDPCSYGDNDCPYKRDHASFLWK
jgi:hypothetical protein